MVKKILLKNLMCTGCADKIEKKVSQLPYVSSASFNFASQALIIDVEESYSQKSFDEIKKIVKRIEPDVEPMPYELRHTEEKHSFFKQYRIILIGLIVMAFGSLLGYFELSNPRNNILYWLGYGLIAHNIIKNAFNGLLTKQVFNENVLIFVATFAAMMVQKPFEAIAVIIFYSVGEHLQNKAIHQSKDEISSLVDLQIEAANVIEDGNIVIKEPLSIKTNDRLLIKHGEKIPVDGVLIKGHTKLNTSALSGESKLQFVKENDQLLSGTINVGNVIEMRATKEYKDSTLAQIIDLIENATNKKSSTEQFITKFAKIYTPLVTFFAIMIALIPSLLNPEGFQDYLFRAATFLVISCPCALVLSIPLSYYAGIGRSAKEGILFKGSNVLDAMNNVDYIGFDKTGTLTKGTFKVTHYTNELTLKIAASIEQYSNHPIAKSILDAFDGELMTFSDIKEIPGLGIEGIHEKNTYLIGSEGLMRHYNIAHDDIKLSVHSVIYVAKDGEYVGKILLEDMLRDDVKTTLSALKKQAKLMMFTGDNDHIASEVAKNIGLDDYKANLLPQEKIDAFNANKLSKTTMYVGDGINDAPLLKNADIGVSLSEGSEIAIDVADVIIMNNDLTLIEKSFSIASKTRQIVMQNIILTLGFKLLFLSLASVGMTSMILAIFADVGVALIAVLNAMRIIYKKGL